MGPTVGDFFAVFFSSTFVCRIFARMPQVKDVGNRWTIRTNDVDGTLIFTSKDIDHLGICSAELGVSWAKTLPSFCWILSWIKKCLESSRSTRIFFPTKLIYAIYASCIGGQKTSDTNPNFMHIFFSGNPSKLTNLGLKKKRCELSAMTLLGMPSLPDIKNPMCIKFDAPPS